MRALRRLGIKVILWSLPVGLVVGLILVIVSLFIGDPPNGSRSEETAPAPTAVSTPPAAVETPGVATGCLDRGPGVAAQLLKTQQEAGPDGAGAAEFAGAWARWFMTGPYQDKDQVLSATTADPAYWASKIPVTPEISSASLSNALYRTRVTDGVDAWTDVALDWQKTGESARTAYTTFHLVWRDGRWMVDTVQPPNRPVRDFIAGMSAYSAGC